MLTTEEKEALRRGAILWPTEAELARQARHDGSGRTHEQNKAAYKCLCAIAKRPLK